jgi:hypothetical protein
VLVGLAALGELGPEERIAVEKDGRQAQNGAVFFAELLDASSRSVR